MNKELTSEHLRKLLHYDGATGVFTWLVKRRGTKLSKVAGRNNLSTTYHEIRVDGRNYLSHRLAWLWMTGEWPVGQIDHKNRDRTDNRWVNLRVATPSQNRANEGLRANNSSGVRGVYWNKVAKKWHVQIKRGGRRVHLGMFADLAEAAAVARKEHAETWGQFANNA